MADSTALTVLSFTVLVSTTVIAVLPNLGRQIDGYSSTVHHRVN